MGFFEKQNPKATKRSVILWAVIGVMVGLIGTMVFNSRLENPMSWVFVLPWMTLICAFAFAVIEWQVPRDVDGDEPLSDSPQPTENQNDAL